MKKLVLLSLSLLSSLAMQATDITVNNIIYTVSEDGASASVSSNMGRQYLVGTIVIEDSVTSDSVTFYPVTSIGANALNSCWNFTEVIIPETVTSIGNGAFSGCNALASVILPEKLTFLGNGAFSNTAIPTITIPMSLTTIEGGAFGAALDLAQFVVPAEHPRYSTLDGVLFTKNQDTILAYPNAKGSSYIIPSSVTTIGPYAFIWSRDMTSITIPSSVETICRGAFQSCNGVTSIQIPASVKTIEEQAFYACCYIESWVLPEGLQTIGKNAFNWNFSMTSLTIPSTVTSIGDGAFALCYALSSLTITSTGAIGANAFKDCRNLLSVTIPEGVTSIGDNAFSGCYGFKSVSIPSTVSLIGENAFAYCSGITRITIPEGLKTIANGTFQGCSALDSVIIPESVNSIGRNAFYYCSLLDSIVIPSSVNYVGEYALYSTPWFDNQPDGLVYAGLVAYKYKGDMPENTAITLNDGTKGVSGYAFDNCANMISILIPADVCQIGPLPFKGCTALTGITVDKSSASFNSEEGVLFTKNVDTLICYPTGKTTTSYILPSTVTVIKDNAFFNCKTLTNVSIPEGVTSIGEYAFSGCTGLASLTLPLSLNYIGMYGFYDCNGLRNIYCMNPTPINIEYPGTFGNIDVFMGVPKYACTLHVPSGSLAAYQTAGGWKDFAAIVDDISDVPSISEIPLVIVTEGNNILIKNLEPGTTISIYTSDGVLLLMRQTNENEQRFTLSPGALYFIKAGNQTVKVAL
ncbi:MAG: leucine-rich repeat domain-containing protein [Bacteroidales bacterium]|nr:leucine-rich repeat domain-containing protein [Bacteroidales bacterium]